MSYERHHLGNADEPANAYEAEMFDSMDRAMLFLEPIIFIVSQQGYLDSEPKSRGLLLAINRLLSIRLIEHCTNQMLTKEQVGPEIEMLVKNIQLMVDENYDRILGLVLSTQAEGATKQ